MTQNRLSPGRIVYIRWLSTWVRGTITESRGGSVAVETQGTTIHVHRSVYHRDLRLTEPKGTDR